MTLSAKGISDNRKHTGKLTPDISVFDDVFGGFTCLSVQVAMAPSEEKMIYCALLDDYDVSILIRYNKFSFQYTTFQKPLEICF